MIIKKNIGQVGKWIFNDGSQPFQVRAIHSHEIGNQEHLHKTMIEYFYVVRGTMIISINGQPVHMREDDLVVVEPGEPHVVTEKSPDLFLFLIMPPPVPGDKEDVHPQNLSYMSKS